MPTQSETVSHGKYLLRIALFGDRWQGQAYRNDRKVGERFAATTRDQLLQAMRSDLNDRDQKERASHSATGAPSADAYLEAFRRLGRLPAGHQAMLDAHLSARRHIITASQLADAAGYANYSAANLQYGTLGRQLADELSWNPPLRPDGSPIWTYTLATAVGDGHLTNEELMEELSRSIESSPNFEWLMREQVVDALTRLQAER